MSTEVEASPAGAGATSDEPARAAAFEGSPYGVVLGREDRSLYAFNPAARDLLGGVPRTCCDAFGCGEPDTPLEHACITELALDAAGDTLPEIRADVDDGAVWATARCHSTGTIVFAVRPGDRGDRRRRTDPHWLAGPRLEVNALGRVRLATDGGSLVGQWLEQRPGQIFKYLLAHRNRTVPSEELAEAFWPEQPASLNSVRHFVHVLRERLEPGRTPRAPSSFVVARNGGYGIDRERVQVDADEFERAALAGLEADRAGDVEAGEPQLQLACALYAGEFIADEPYADWVLAERERLHALAGRALRALSRLHAAAGDLERATPVARRLAELNPFDEGAQRQVIVLLLREGRRTDAIKRYDALRARLRQRFEEQPEFTLAEAMAEARTLAAAPPA